MSVSETAHSGISENSLGAASYLTVIPAIVFLAIAPYNRSANVRFHAWQSVLLGATAFLINFAFNALAQATSLFSGFVVLSVSMSIGIAYFMIAIFCSIRALNGKHTKLPPFSAWAERQANR
jgi:uncharacterized membrane protein